MSKLYELSRGDSFRLLDDAPVPPGAPAVSTGTIYRLGNIDGLYSFCRDADGNVVHIAAYASVEKIDE